MLGRGLAVFMGICIAATAWGAGSGLNVIVVVNQNSTNSVQLGNEYCAKRSVPPQNLLRMTGWTGGSVSWSRASFERYLRDPLFAAVASRNLSTQALYVLLSMDIPYRVTDGGNYNSTTSTLFYGFKTNTTPPAGLPATCSLPDDSTNSYSLSELAFGQAFPATAPTNSLLALMLTDDTFLNAESILDRGVASDSSFPTQAVYLEKTTDSARNVRFFAFDNAIFSSRLRGDYSVMRIASDSTSFTNILGLLTGRANFALPTDAFVPGAMGDSLTSYGGYILENNSQTSLLAFLNAGAAGSYGTIVEPCNYTEKFPDPLVYFYQHRGFSLAESYYLGLRNPYQGLLVGEPLSAPFARRGAANWDALAEGTVLSGQALFPAAVFTASRPDLPIGQVDLFLDGRFLQTVTNLPPGGSDVIAVTVNGIQVRFTVPPGMTLASACSGLAGALNARSGRTQVVAASTGDRIELQSLDATRAGTDVTLDVSVSSGSATPATTVVTPAQPAFLDSEAPGYLSVVLNNAPVVGDWLRADFVLTNGSAVNIGVTNTVSGATAGSFAQSVMNKINSVPGLQSAGGVLAADRYAWSSSAQFFLYARSAGWAAAKIRVTFSTSENLSVSPTGTATLEDNLSDLRPRNHLYLSSGLASLPVSFQLDTSQLPDGFHELSLVGYEGTSVRTQTRVSRQIRVQNTTLSAAIFPSLAGTNFTLDTQLRFTVTANTPEISRIELFSTGGSIGTVSNLQSAVFPVPMSFLGIGRHPFHALVTDTTGHSYQTETIGLQIIPSFKLTISGSPPVLSWASVPGLSYAILVSTNLSSAFEQAAIVTASGSDAQWSAPASESTAVFYRVALRP